MQTASLIFEIIEFAGITAFAISGAMISIVRKMDVFGVVFLGFITALGGGAFRDVFLGVFPPRNFCNAEHLFCAVVTSLCVFIVAKIFNNFFFNNYKKINTIINIFDALGLAAFTISGIRLTVEAGYGDHEFFTIFMGLLTAVGGGLLRDIMSKATPLIFCKNVYATAVLLGAICYFFLGKIVPDLAAILVTFVVVVAIRILAATFHWDLPKIERPTQQ
ncbi:MAG: trimeric intracellular cation channel family protein [Clostridia bacterium]|nr:trimeric intracellular cation channel family protein [Clostridia bacterium]